MTAYKGNHSVQRNLNLSGNRGLGASQWSSLGSDLYSCATLARLSPNLSYINIMTTDISYCAANMDTCPSTSFEDIHNKQCRLYNSHLVLYLASDEAGNRAISPGIWPAPRQLAKGALCESSSSQRA